LWFSKKKCRQGTHEKTFLFPVKMFAEVAKIVKSLRRPLWEHWLGEEPAIDSCAIITTDANDVVRPLHDRMPVILDPRDYPRWLDPANADYVRATISPSCQVGGPFREGWEPRIGGKKLLYWVLAEVNLVTIAMCN
jgi:hypothetical protein